MKKIICFALLMVSMLARSQEYAACNDDQAGLNGWDYVPFIDPGKQWNVMWTSYEYGGAPAGKTTMEFWISKNDTIINDTIYKMVITNNLNLFSKDTIGFIREDIMERKVYFRSNIAGWNQYTFQDRLLYDFSLEAGESVDAFGLLPCAYSNTVKVISTSVVNLLNGEERKVWDLGDELWIEGIGSLNGMPFPGCYQLLTISFSLDLLCYYEDGIKLFSSEEDSCYIEWSSNIAEPFVSDIISYPNPAIHEFTISLPDSHQGCNTCQIFDLGGRLFSEEVCCGQEFRLNVQNLDPGIYFLRIVSHTSAITHRFLKL